MSTPIIGLIGNLDNYHVKCDMNNTLDRLMMSDTLSIMLPYTKNLCKPTADREVLEYRKIMTIRKFQITKCDEIMIINSGGDVPYLIQIEAIYAKDILNKRVSYFYGGYQNAYDKGYNEIIKIWNTGYPYELHGCKIIDNDVDLGIRKAPINPPLIDPELMSKVDPMIINKKKKYHGELTNDIIEEIFKDA